jgi:hypothetical protein
MKRRIGRAALAVLGIVPLISCSTPVAPGFIPADEPGRIVMALGADQNRWATDPIALDSGWIARDTLFLAVSHGGGCADHAYALVASNGWMESSPVQLGVFLAHDAKGDTCKALLLRQLIFDLAPAREAYRAAYVRGGGGGEFILVIRSADRLGSALPGLRLLYRF